MTYLTEMDKHAPLLRTMQRLRVGRIFKRADGSWWFDYTGSNNNLYTQRMLDSAAGSWLLALDFIDGAEGATDEYNHRFVFTLNHDRITDALVAYEAAAAALAEVK